jgi:hypothetical protein
MGQTTACIVAGSNNESLTVDSDDRVRTAIAPLGIGNYTCMPHIWTKLGQIQLGIRTTRTNERYPRAQQRGKREPHPHCCCYRERRNQ